jgi:hypothetical protein
MNDEKFEKIYNSISRECREMYEQNKKLWNEIFNLGKGAERRRSKYMSQKLARA